MVFINESHREVIVNVYPECDLLRLREVFDVGRLDLAREVRPGGGVRQASVVEGRRRDAVDGAWSE